ncbi:MAG: MFS transporter [Gammaproteobacteria bacterium]|nr:MFS transporter [Gammaproteobacteria bacterium]
MNVPDPALRHRIRPRFLILAGLTGAFALLSSTMSKTPTLPLFAHHLGADPAAIGATAMASTIPGILISLPAGLLRDRLGARPLLLLALFVFATAPFLYLLVTDIAQLALIRFYHGFATAIFGTALTAEIAERFRGKRGQALATYSAMSTVGRSCAPFLGGFLISTTGFPGVFLGCGAAALAALVLGIRLPAVRPRSQARETHTKTSVAAVWHDPIIRATSLVEATQFLVYGAVEAFLALYTTRTGWPAWKTGILLGLQLVSVVFLKPYFGRLSDRHGRARFIRAGLVAGAVSLCALPFTHAFVPLLVINMLFGAGFAATTAATSALVGDRSRAGGFGAGMGLLRTIMDVGQATGPVLTGVAVAIGGYHLAFPLLGVLLAAVLLLFVSDTRATQVP